jgi:hypothetical protein
MKTLRLLLLVLLAVGSFSKHGLADQPISLIQTLCIPEPGIDYFSVRLQTFAEIANYINLGHGRTPKEEREARLKTLEKYGLIYPTEFSYTCKLLNHTYTITGHRPPPRERGMCGGDPRLVLSLKRDDEIILDDVFFESSCFSDLSKDPFSYVESFSVEDGSAAHGQYIEAVVSDGMKKKTILFNGDLKNLNHDQLYCLAHTGFFDHGRFATARKEIEPYEHCDAPKRHHHAGGH